MNKKVACRTKTHCSRMILESAITCCNWTSSYPKIYKSKIKSRKKCKKYVDSFCIAHFWLNLKQCVYLEAFLSRSSIFCSLSSSDAFSYNCRAKELFFSSCSARPTGSGLLHTYLMPEMYCLYYRKAKVL